MMVGRHMAYLQSPDKSRLLRKTVGGKGEVPPLQSSNKEKEHSN